MPAVTPPLRVMHLCGTSTGAPWLVEMLSELKKRAYDVSAIINGHEGFAQRLSHIGVPYVVADHNILAGAQPLRAARKVRHLASFLSAQRPDILHSHLYPSNIAGRIAGWLADVPIRLSMNAGPFYLDAPQFAPLDVATARTDTRIIASCEYVRHRYVELGLRPEHIELVYYGSNHQRFDPSRADRTRVRTELGVAAHTPLIGQVAYFYPPPTVPGRAAPHLLGRGIKGHDVVIRAIPRVLTEFPAARFVFVGDGWGERGVRYRQEMEALADRVGVRDAVIFAGFRTDIPDVLAALDVGLQCSRSENLGGSVEALLMETPLIASRTGGLVDTVRHNQTGLLVPTDSPDALADAIVVLLRDRAKAHQFGVAGRQLMLERFTAERTGSDLDELYKRLAADTRFGGGPPSACGYRPLTSAVRWMKAPFWAADLVATVLRARRVR